MMCSDCVKQKDCLEKSKTDKMVRAKMYKNDFWENAELCKGFKKSEERNEEKTK